MKLAYDDDYLTYTGAQWANSIEGNANNVQLISEVKENGKPALNISSILGAVYSNNETMVTLNFTVRKDYATMPVTLTNRAITESSAGFPEVTVNIVVDAKAGLPETPTESESESQSESQNNSENNNNNNNSNNNNNNSNNNNSNNNNNNNSNNSNNSSNNNSNNNNSNNNSSSNNNGNKLDKTPKTGAVDIRFLLGGAIVVFLGVAGICIKVLRKKKS